MDTQTYAVLARIAIPPTRAFGTTLDEAAFVATGHELAEWWEGRESAYRLEAGIEPAAMAAVSQDAVWLACRLGLTVAMAAAPGGMWVSRGPRLGLFFVPATGDPSR
jgi:hypothetical protein